jgi:hypothetical protein
MLKAIICIEIHCTTGLMLHQWVDRRLHKSMQVTPGHVLFITLCQLRIKQFGVNLNGENIQVNFH